MTDDHKDGEDSPLHYEGGIPILPGPANSEDANRDRDKKEEQKYKQEQSAIQRGILCTQIALVVFGIIGAGVSLWQARISQQSADTSEKSVLLAQRGLRDQAKDAAITQN